MTAPSNGYLAPFVPRVVQRWLAESGEQIWREVNGSLAFVDISGFTALTERLGRRGRVGAEEMSDILDTTFAALLATAQEENADLVKWGGDALLLLVEGPGHADRAVRLTVRMQERIAQVGAIAVGSARTTLRMSAGVHSGRFDLFLVGDPRWHRELLLCGPGVTRTVEMESLAGPGEVVVSRDTAALIDQSFVGAAVGEGFRVTGCPPLSEELQPQSDPAGGAAVDLEVAVPSTLRAHFSQQVHSAEHRRIAVAFIAFSGTDELRRQAGSDGLAVELDRLIRQVQDACARHGVTFLESDIDANGGKVLLTAGAPVSADFNEERLLLAVRQIVGASSLFAVRGGVNRGPVFAGDFGPPQRRTYSVKGDAVNLAARLLGRAEPGQLVATMDLLTHCATEFRVDALPAFSVKGKSGLIDAAVVHEPARIEQAAEQQPLVGRDDELGRILTLTDAVAAGVGGALVVSGGPGIGKSRLVEEVVDRWAGPTITTRCETYESATPYWPFRAVLREALELSRDASDDELRTALVAHAHRCAPALEEWLPLVAAVADLPWEETAATGALAEDFRAQRTESVVVDLLRSTLLQPTLIVVHDAHLADAATASLLAAWAARIGEAPWGLLVLRRDSPDTGYLPGGDVPSLALPPLDGVASAVIVRRALESTHVTDADVAAIAERGSGNPLFLSGLAAAVREGADVAVLPDTVEATVTAQLDRLPVGERMLVRIAAVLGMSFSVEEVEHLVEGLSAIADDTRLAGIPGLLQTRPGEFRFEQRLLRDTAYEGLPHRLRRRVHERAALRIESTSSDPNEVAGELSAHFLAAGRFDSAWLYACIAGQRAVAKSAYAEAEVLYGRALDAGRRLRTLTRSERSTVYLELGAARRRVGRGQLALADFRKARQLADGEVEQAEILSREASLQRRLGRYSSAIRTANRGLSMLEDIGGRRADRVRSELQMLCSGVRAHQGDYPQALDWARKADVSARASRDAEARADALAMIHLSLMMLGRPDAGYAHRALTLYERVGNTLAASETLNNLALEAWMAERPEEALDGFRRAQEMATRAGDAFQAAATRANVGDVLVRLGQFEAAEVELVAVLSELQALGARSYEAMARRSLALALAHRGDIEGAQDQVARARTMFIELGEADELAETDEVGQAVEAAGGA